MEDDKLTFKCLKVDKIEEPTIEHSITNITSPIEYSKDKTLYIVGTKQCVYICNSDNHKIVHEIPIKNAISCKFSNTSKYCCCL